MATTVDHGDLLHDPEAMMIEREALAIRSMSALIGIAEGGKDERARVAAATELNKMLSLGLANRGNAVRATQINNLKLPPGRATDAATSRLLEKFSPVKPDIEADVSETLEALSEGDDE
jgi:hypothetical protein